MYYESGLYRVNYENGDFEDLESVEIRLILVRDDEFDGGLVNRTNKLEKIVLHIGAMVANMADKGSLKSQKDEPVVGATDSSELNGEDDGFDVDLSSDYVSDVEIVPLPPTLQLSPSSGTIDVLELSVLHLLSVYGFLRSFSTQLFLRPFTLDEFVGALNYEGSNTLFDAIIFL